jgi:hypothetical protein
MFFCKLKIAFLRRALHHGVNFKCSHICNSLTCSYTNAYSKCPPSSSSRFRILFADNYSFSGLCFLLNLQLSKSSQFILFLPILSSNTRFNLPNFLLQIINASSPFASCQSTNLLVFKLTNRVRFYKRTRNNNQTRERYMWSKGLTISATISTKCSKSVTLATRS